MDPQVHSPYDDKPHAIADYSGKYSGNVYVTWTDEEGRQVLFSRSTDNGMTFEGRRVLFDGNGEHLGSGTNIGIGVDGEIIVAFANYDDEPTNLPENAIRVTSSNDGGTNFTSSEILLNINGLRGSDPNFNDTRVNSFPSMAADHAGQEYLERRGNLYLVYAGYNEPFGSDADIFLLKREGYTGMWADEPINVYEDPDPTNPTQQWFPSVDVDSTTGYIYVSYYNQINASDFYTARFVSVSKDLGETFEHYQLSDVEFIPVSQRVD